MVFSALLPASAKYLVSTEYSGKDCTGFISKSRFESGDCLSSFGQTNIYQKITKAGTVLQFDFYDNSNCTGNTFGSSEQITAKEGSCDKDFWGDSKNYTYTLVDDPEVEFTKGKDYYSDTFFNSGDCSGRVTEEILQVLGECLPHFVGTSIKYENVNGVLTNNEYTSSDCSGTATTTTVNIDQCGVLGGDSSGAGGAPGGGGREGVAPGREV